MMAITSTVEISYQDRATANGDQWTVCVVAADGNTYDGSGSSVEGALMMLVKSLAEEVI